MKKLDWFEQGLLDARPMLMSYAMKLCRNVTTAEDLVQDTMLRALASRHGFTEGTNLAAWLSTMLTNVFRSNRRLHDNARVTLCDDPRYADHIPAVDNPERSLIVKEMIYMVDTLSEKKREAVWLIGGGGCLYEEAAQMLGIAVGTLKGRTARGRKRLVELTGGL